MSHSILRFAESGLAILSALGVALSLAGCGSRALPSELDRTARNPAAMKQNPAAGKPGWATAGKSRDDVTLPAIGSRNQMAADSLTSLESVPEAAIAANLVTIDNFTFAPQSLAVPIGTTVTWINRDDVPHTVKDTEQQFKSEALDTDDMFSFRFTKAGEYSYFCGIHPHMTGKIVVK